jgi:hypothetical protein
MPGTDRVAPLHGPGRNLPRHSGGHVTVIRNGRDRPGASGRPPNALLLMKRLPGDKLACRGCLREKRNDSRTLQSYTLISQPFQLRQRQGSTVPQFPAFGRARSAPRPPRNLGHPDRSASLRPGPAPLLPDQPARPGRSRTPHPPPDRMTSSPHFQLPGRPAWYPPPSNCPAGFRLPASGFRLPAFGFRLPASGFRLPASGFRLPASGFRLPASGFRLPASGFRLPASGFRVPTSWFHLSFQVPTPVSRCHPQLPGSFTSFQVPSPSFRVPSPTSG